jgi:flagellar basal-body rod modification protein FlgD
MSVSSVGGTTNTANTSNSSSSSSTDQTSSATALDYNSFLSLLMAEMQNQDPTNPMDSTQYVAQPATFSEVGQSTETNTKLDQLLQSSALSQAGSIIGRTVTSADGTASGTVSQVKVLSDSVTAVLTDGTEVPITEGVTIQ